MREENLKHHKIKGSQVQQGRKKQNSKVIMQHKQRRRKTLTLWRITKYGANSFVRNAWLSVAATAVMTVTLVIIFGSLLARSILMDTVDDIKNKVDMSIYLKKGVSNSDILKMQKAIKDLPSVTDITYTSPQEARDRFARKNSADADIRKALIESNNEFFGIFNVKLVDISNSTELKNLVENNKLIKSNLDPDHPPTYASDRNEIIKNISNTINFAEKVGILAGSIFVIIASLIIFNTIRMAIFNRREEIYMMKLIGANKSFIAGPFLVEISARGLWNYHFACNFILASLWIFGCSGAGSCWFIYWRCFSIYGNKKISKNIERGLFSKKDCGIIYLRIKLK